VLRETRVRKALYAAGQQLYRDFSDPRQGGQWLTRPGIERHIGTTQTAVSTINLGGLLTGTLLEGLAGRDNAVNLNYNQAEAGLARLDASSTTGQWLYLLEAPDAPQGYFKALKVGQVKGSLVKRYDKSDDNYKYEAYSQGRLTWHLFRLEDLPASVRYDAQGREIPLKDLEKNLRRQVYGKWRDAPPMPNWLPEDRSNDLTQQRKGAAGDPMNGVFGRYDR
jgi:hypothetical protein